MDNETLIKRIENQRTELMRLAKRLRSAEESRKHWKAEAKRLGNLLHYAIQAKPQWISVEERLPDPKEYDWVLVNVTDDLDGTFLVPHVAEHRDGDWYGLGEEFALSELKLSVTHWMPLPEPPKGGAE